jgi:hypothetical protein
MSTNRGMELILSDDQSSLPRRKMLLTVTIVVFEVVALVLKHVEMRFPPKSVLIISHLPEEVNSTQYLLVQLLG